MCRSAVMGVLSTDRLSLPLCRAGACRHCDLTDAVAGHAQWFAAPLRRHHAFQKSVTCRRVATAGEQLMSCTVNLDRRFAENELVRVSFARDLKGDIADAVVSPRVAGLTE